MGPKRGKKQEVEVKGVVKRQVNYTQDEIDLLINEVQKRKGILFSSFTNSITNDMMEKEWKIIAQKISAVGSVVRTGKQVRHKWGDLSSRTKGKSISHAKAMRQTGGGINPVPELSETENKLLAVIGTTAVHGVSGGMDTDCVLTQEDPEDRPLSPVDQSGSQPYVPGYIPCGGSASAGSSSTASSDPSYRTQSRLADPGVVRPDTDRPSITAASTGEAEEVSDQEIKSPTPQTLRADKTRSTTIKNKKRVDASSSSSAGEKANSDRLVDIETKRLNIEKKMLQVGRLQYKAMQDIADVMGTYLGIKSKSQVEISSESSAEDDDEASGNDESYMLRVPTSSNPSTPATARNINIVDSDSVTGEVIVDYGYSYQTL